MCTCVWREYCCECNKPDCPHKQPSHSRHHVQDKLFQIDHKAWRYCPDFIERLDAVKKELQDAISKNNSSTATSNNEPSKSTSRQQDKAVITRPSSCFKDSTDPRHDGRLPLCKEIWYSAKRIVKDCDYCRDYWIGRSMDNAF